MRKQGAAPCVYTLFLFVRICVWIYSFSGCGKRRAGCPKKHKASCKKYKPCILKYKALILKYVPYIFREKRYLIFNNLQNPQKEGQFRGV